jgi:hypothetical protein
MAGVGTTLSTNRAVTGQEVGRILGRAKLGGSDFACA